MLGWHTPRPPLLRGEGKGLSDIEFPMDVAVATTGGETHVINPVGSCLPVVHKFKYLGSWVTTDGRDDLDVDERISSAARQMAMLKDCVFHSSEVCSHAKHAVYTGLVLNTLLYGSESWCLPEYLIARLHRFHMDQARFMCRKFLWHQQHQLLNNNDVLNRTHLKPLRSYLARRRLRWLGHVARMGQHRLPRQLLSSWVYNPRPRGAPLMTFGRSISKDLQEAGVEIDGWYEVAQNRALWREVVRHLAPPDETKNNDPHNQATTNQSTN